MTTKYSCSQFSIEGLVFLVWCSWFCLPVQDKTVDLESERSTTWPTQDPARRWRAVGAKEGTRTDQAGLCYLPAIIIFTLVGRNRQPCRVTCHLTDELGPSSSSSSSTLTLMTLWGRLYDQYFPPVTMSDWVILQKWLIRFPLNCPISETGLGTLNCSGVFTLKFHPMFTCCWQVKCSGRHSLFTT